MSTSGDTSVLPLTVKGRKEEKVTVSITLRDTRNAADYTLDIPYTIRNLMPYTVQYMNDGVVVDSAEVLEGETLKLPSWPGMFSGYGNRYAFKGWYIKDGDGTFYAKGSDYTVTSDVIFEAAWLRAFNVYITGKGSTATLTSNHDYIPAYEFSQTKYAANTKFTIQIQQTYLPGTAENPKITLKDDQYTAEYRNGTWYFTIPQSTFGTTYTTHPT